MPLDPQAAAVLEAMPINLEDFTGITPELMRLGFETPDDGEPEPVAEVRDLRIAGGAGEQDARLYRPEGASASSPCVVFFHGGGWVLGNLSSHDGTVRALANRSGMVFVAVDYRLAPEAPFPAAVDDCAAALAWVHANAGDLGVDPDRLAVMGDSAGGNLAAVVANASRTAGPPLRAQVLIYPCTDMEPDRWPSMTENANGYLLTRAAMEWFYGHYIDSEQRADPRAAPIREADLAGAPAALVLTAEFDPLRDEGEAYAAALTDAGVATTLSRYDGLIHGFIGMHDAIDQSVAAQEEVAQFLRETLS